MKFGDFSDINFIIFFAIMVVLFISLLTIVIVFSVSVRSDRRFRERVDYESTTTRIYIIDVKKNKIVQLNKSDMSHKITYDLYSFYSSFHPNDSEKVKNWIFQICVDPKSAGEYLEADVLINGSRKVYFSLLRLLEYKHESGLIHLEDHILKYIQNTYNKQGES